MESFGIERQNPRALTSEGHLDSLGICIFMAFVRKFNEHCSLIVFDDIVTTIDSQHRRKIGELILRELKDKQVFILTHDTMWYEQMRFMQQALRIGNFDNRRITNWDLDWGIEIKPFIHKFERIPIKIADNDKLGAGNLTRTYLEWILENVCLNTEAKVIYKRYPNNLTSNDLFGPAKERLTQKIKDKTINTEIEEAFLSIDLTGSVGNLFSHHNIDADNVSIKDVKSFYEAVTKLHNLVVCPNCKKFLKYHKDLRCLRCNCTSPTIIKT